MGVEFKLPSALESRLKLLGLSEEEIKESIEKYSEVSRVYIDSRLGGISLKEEQIDIIKDCYIQYKLFADVGMDEARESQRLFMDRLIKDIKDNADFEKAEKRQDRSIKRIRVI